MTGPPTHKRRTARGHGEPKQHSRLQLELLEAIFSSTNLEAAYRRVKANGGAAGVDGVSLEDFTLWYRLRRKDLLRRLHLGNYCPSPVRRTHIEKKNGKKRPLGIPTVFDRIVQQAIHQVLCPILDSSFSPNSYGFRPCCRGHDAVRRIFACNREGFKWSVDIDLKSCSGSFGPVLSLRSEVVLLKSERAAHRVFASLCEFVENKLGLEINREKSAVRPVKELNYLSFRFHAGKIKVSESSLADFKYKLKELSSRNWGVSIDYRMHKIRQYIKGWMGYFGLSEIYTIWAQ